MKLITESDNIGKVRLKRKSEKIISWNGIFAQADCVNRNNRIYPKDVLKNAISEYIENFVKTNRALGELNHPEEVLVNPERSAILIKELHWERK